MGSCFAKSAIRAVGMDLPSTTFWRTIDSLCYSIAPDITNGKTKKGGRSIEETDRLAGFASGLQLVSLN